MGWTQNHARPEGSNCAVSNSGTLPRPEPTQIPSAWPPPLRILPSPSAHATPVGSPDGPCRRGPHAPAGHHPQSGPQGDPRSPSRGSEGVQIPSTLHGTTPSAEPQAPRGPPRDLSEAQNTQGLPVPLYNPPPPHRSRSETLTPERETRPSARSQISQRSQCPQRDPGLLGVSLDPPRRNP